METRKVFSFGAGREFITNGDFKQVFFEFKRFVVRVFRERRFLQMKE